MTDYADLGVKPIINACATLTRLGGSITLILSLIILVWHYRRLKEINRFKQTTTIISIITIILSIICGLFVSIISFKQVGNYKYLTCKSQVLITLYCFYITKYLFHLFLTFRLELAFKESFLKSSKC